MKTILNNNQAFAIFKQNASNEKNSFLRLHVYNKVKEGVSYSNTYKIVNQGLEPDHIYDISLNDGYITIQAMQQGKNIVLQLLSSSTGFYENDSHIEAGNLLKNKWHHFLNNPYKFIMAQLMPTPKWPVLSKV
jgi:hypothetical protein